MNFNVEDFFGVKTKAQFEESEKEITEVNAQEKPVEVPMPEQTTKVVVSLDTIMAKLFEGVNESSINKYRSGYLKMEERFQTEKDKRMEGISDTANSILSLFTNKKESDENNETSPYDKENWIRYRDNFRALSPDEKLALNSLLTDEVKRQMSKGELTLLQELIDNYTVKAEMDSMNPFAF